MPRALRPCSTPGCPEVVAQGRCDTHTREAEQRRGSARERGYGTAHEHSFRTPVLRRDPVCTCTATHHAWHTGACPAWSTVADHYPLGRDELVARGMDPNDPQHGRGLCARCHNAETARHQPGGWNVT